MRTLPFRSVWVLVHRYAGLAMAAILVVEGISGSLLVFEGPIDQLLAPQTFASARPGVAPLPLSVLAERLEASEPRLRVGYFSIEGRQAVMRVLPRNDSATGKPYPLGFDHVILDPWTGRELIRAREGALSEGAANLMSFVYDLHQNLAVGPWGTILLGVVAVVWTLDCFLAVALTLPVTAAGFLRHWKTAWLLKWPASAFRFTFDLHRASGLWLWPVWFVFAWSSVMFTLPEQVYEPVTGALFNYRSDAATAEAMSRRPQSSDPKIGWREAEALGARYMAQAAASHGFAIRRPYGMAYIPGWNVYTYAVVSSLNLQANDWNTSLWLDGDDGRLVELDLPSQALVGNKIDLWLRALHFADLDDSLAYRIFVFVLGLLTALISVTGVLIWLRKRKARIAHLTRSRSSRTSAETAARRPL
jgi:uncharacterized iron-regulated membrane protein